MRQFAGYGTPEDTNRRYRELLAAGATGLSVAFDLPTLMGRDPDHPLSLGEVGKCGVNVTSLADMEALFDGIPLGDVTTSMTINSPASMIFAMYLVVAERQGADWRAISGTIQNDILKEFIAQKEYIYPPRPSMRLITDIFAFCGEQVPRWNTISVSGYHIREAGATARRSSRSRCATPHPAARASLAGWRPTSTSTPRLPQHLGAEQPQLAVAQDRPPDPRGAHGPVEDFQRGGQRLHEHRVGVGDRVGHPVEIGDRQGQVGGERAVQVKDAQHPAVGTVAGVAPAARRAHPAGDVDLAHHPRPFPGGVGRARLDYAGKLMPQHARKALVASRQFQIGMADPGATTRTRAQPSGTAGSGASSTSATCPAPRHSNARIISGDRS